MFYIKQSESTAARRRVPIYLVDSTDGYTPETGVTSPTIEVSKNGGTQASSAGSFTEIGDGNYYYEFSTGEIDTLGWVHVRVAGTGCREYNCIVHITAYDAYASAGLGLSNLDAQVSTRASESGGKLETALDEIYNIQDELNGLKVRTGAATGGTTTTAILDGGSSYDDFYNNYLIGVKDAGLFDWCFRTITDYDGTSKTVTVEPAFSFDVDNGDDYVIFHAGAKNLLTAYDAAKTAAPESGGNIADIKTVVDDNLDKPISDVYNVTSPVYDAVVRESSTAGGGGANYITLNPGSQDTTDFYKGCIVVIWKAGYDPQTRRIISQTSLTCYVDRNWDSNPAFGTGYVIVTDVPSLLTSDYDSAKTAAQDSTVAKAAGAKGTDATFDLVDAADDEVTFLRRVLTNKRVWDAANSRWAIYNDAGDTILYYLKVYTPSGGNVTLPSDAIATGDKVA